MTISVKLNEQDTKLINAYVKRSKISLSDLIRNAVIENEYDIECYKKAIEEYEMKPKTYTLNEIKEKLEL